MIILKFIKKYLKDPKKNFTSGAFVFNDPQLKIFHELYTNTDAYRRISSHQKHFRNDGKTPIGYGLDIPDIKIKYNDKIHTFRTLLFFTYLLPSKNGKTLKRFTYIKPETYGMKKLTHIIRHSINYITSRFEKNHKDHRKEHFNPIGKNKYVYHEDIRIKKTKCAIIPECTRNEIKQLNYTKYYRRGNEVYISDLYKDYNNKITNNKITNDKKLI